MRQESCDVQCFVNCNRPGWSRLSWLAWGGFLRGLYVGPAHLCLHADHRQEKDYDSTIDCPGRVVGVGHPEGNLLFDHLALHFRAGSGIDLLFRYQVGNRMKRFGILGLGHLKMPRLILDA